MTIVYSSISIAHNMVFIMVFISPPPSISLILLLLFFIKNIRYLISYLGKNFMTDLNSLLGLARRLLIKYLGSHYLQLRCMEEPTVKMAFSINTSPFVGREVFPYETLYMAFFPSS
jgi:hypothetical protein